MMSADGRMESKSQDGSLALLRVAAFVAVLVGACGAVALTLYTGRHNASLLLMVIFALWVLSPFVALAAAVRLSSRWAPLTHMVLYAATYIVTLGTLVIYGETAFGPPRAKTAAVFVVVPPASWLLSGVSVGAAGLISGRSARRSRVR
jgi:hypothetical protein